MSADVSTNAGTAPTSPEGQGAQDVNARAASEGVFVAIDMQTAFADPDAQWAVPSYDQITANVQRLADAFGERTTWTRFVRDPAEEGVWREYYDRWHTYRVPEDDPVWDVTLPIAPGQGVLSLPTFSKWGDELAEAAPLGTPLVVCGVATDCCVLSTVLGAIDAGREVIVVTDACAGATDEAHDQTVALLGLLNPMVKLTTTDAVLAAF